MTTETGLSQQPQTDPEPRSHAGIPDWAGFLITVAILAYWLPKWVLVLLPATLALWAAGRIGQTLDRPWLARRPTSLAWSAIGGIGLLALFRVPPMALTTIACLLVAAFVLMVIHIAGWPRYRAEVLALVTGKWFRAGGWLFVFLGKLVGYVVGLGVGGVAIAAARSEHQPPSDDKGPYYIKHAYWDDQLGWVDSHGIPECVRSKLLK